MSSTVGPAQAPEGWHILIVASLTETETELQVRFRGGEVAAVGPAVPDRPLLHQYLSSSLLYGLPLGILFGEDRRILQVGTVVCTEVRGVSDHPHYQHVKNVELGGEAAPRFLSKQHPRFEDMLHRLTSSAATQQLVWCIIQGSTIVEIKTLSQEEDEALCQRMLPPAHWARGPSSPADAPFHRC
jgi:hypothetical protein